MIKFKKQSKQFDGVFINTFFFLYEKKQVLVETLTNSKIINKNIYMKDLLNIFKTITKDNLKVRIDDVQEDNTVDAELFVNKQHFVGLTFTFDYYDKNWKKYHKDIFNIILAFVTKLNKEESINE